MAAVTVSAELKLRDGKRQKTRVQVQNNMTSLIHGVRELNASVSRLLTELVQREKAHGAEEREDEDGDEDEDEDPLNPEIQPPAKRPRS